MKSLNIFVNDEDVAKIFKEFDKNHNNLIDKEEFKKMIEILMEKPEIEDLFLKYSANSVFMTKAEFIKFGAEVQQSTKNFEEIFNCLCEEKDQEKVLNLDSFLAYIFSPIHNSIVDRNGFEETMDMDQPLAHYFIASSHNTYLEGNQLTGHSSINQYCKVLLDGCRCIEIDAWDGDNEPVVTHGHTFVNKIQFRDVVEEIKSSAFVTSPYPVIISLENHCNHEMTGKLGEILKEILGDMIFKPTGSLLTPNKLKNRFIIKAKLAHSEVSKEEAKDSDDALHTNLASIVGLAPGSFSLNQPYNSIVSLSEKKLKTTVFNHGSAKTIHYHCKSFSRIYPKGLRIDSSNYNPILA